MQFIPKQPRIEAEKVSLSGQDLMAVVVDDAAHLVAGEVFRLFFQARVVEAAKTPRKVPTKKASKPRKLSAVSGESGSAPEAEAGITYSAAVRQAVAELPRTATEIKHRVEVITGRKADSSLVSTLLSQMRAKNLVAKRDDLKWYPIAPMGGGSMRRKLAIFWCQLMHDAPMWPRKTYRCRVCHVEHATPWALTDVEKLRVEQRLAKAHIAAGEGFPAVLGALDWMAEELEAGAHQ